MSARVEVVDPGVLRIVLPGRASNAYLFLGGGSRSSTPAPRSRSAIFSRRCASSRSSASGSRSSC